MSLTPKQEAFCLAYTETGNASEAYRQAYPRARNWKPETVHREAHALLNNPKISTRLDELKAALVERNLWTREQSVKALIEVVNNPDKQTDVIAAVKELNAMHGYNAPEKVEVRNPDCGAVILKLGDHEIDPKKLGW